MKGFGEVFRFTLKQQFAVRSVRVLTIVVALLLFIIPVAVISLVELTGNEEAVEEETVGEVSEVENASILDAEAVSQEAVKAVFYVVNTDDGYDWDVLSAETVPGFENAVFTQCADDASAASLAEQTDGSLILLLNGWDGGYEALAVLPEGSQLPQFLAISLSTSVSSVVDELLLQQMGVTEPQRAMLDKSVLTEIKGNGEGGLLTEEERARGETKEIIAMFMPYLNIMLMYFLVLYYGQSVANSVILEKTSKLMDTFLIAVKPRAMIFGKVAASWVAALAQFAIWVISLIAGFAAGAAIVRAARPDEDSGFLRLLDLLKGASKLFSLPEIVAALLLIAVGFFLYCSMAGIAGSFASKPEELSATISFFTLTLVISMFITLSAGFLGGEMSFGAKWYDFVPFTATLITPARVLLGYAGLWTGLLSLAITAALSLAFIVFAGRAYTMMSLYKGKVPGIRQILGMIKEKQ